MGDGDRLAVPETAARMAGAASAFVAALTAGQRERACFDFGADEPDAKRRDWSFLPARDRDGLPIGGLGDGQRRLAHELIVSGTSLPGYAKVVSVMAMEHVLRAIAPGSADLFNPERYCFKVFGSPGEQAWGWQFAGHHVSLNFTVVDGRYISPTPCMLGAEPASFGMLAPLADDEELGYRLVNSLDAAQRRAAIIHHRPPPDMATRTVPRIGEVERPDPVFTPEPDYVLSEDDRDILSYIRSSPKGIAASGLDQRQFDMLTALVGGFVRRLPTRWPGPSCTTWSARAWTASPSAGRAAPLPGSGTTTASRDPRCSSSTTTRRGTATTSIRRGGTRRTISATTCWPRTTVSGAAFLAAAFLAAAFLAAAFLAPAFLAAAFLAAVRSGGRRQPPGGTRPAHPGSRPAGTAAAPARAGRYSWARSAAPAGR